MGQPALAIESITVHANRMVCDVVLSSTSPRMTTPRMAQAALRAYPTLARHACVNDKGTTFGCVIQHTSLPHLLEHVVVDLQTRAAPARVDASFAYVGTTEWLDQSANRARVQVNFTDDLVALKCFNQAVTFINDKVVV